MKNIAFLLFASLAYVLILIVTSPVPVHTQEQHKFDVEVWTPAGMPLELKYEFYEPNIIRMTKVIAADARKVSILAVPLDENGEPTRNTVARCRMLTDRPTDPMTWGTADPRVKKLILILEWVEFDTGKWVTDTPYIKFPEVDEKGFSELREFLKRGKENIPPARFEPK